MLLWLHQAAHPRTHATAHVGTRASPSYRPIQAARAALAHELGARAASEVDARPRGRTGKYVPLSERKEEDIPWVPLRCHASPMQSNGYATAYSDCRDQIECSSRYPVETLLLTTALAYALCLK